MEDKARKQEYRPESGFRKRPVVSYALLTEQGLLPVVNPETVIGRSASCDIVLESPLVSRRHARLVWSESGLFLEDLASRNGCLVNQTLVRGSARLSVGDQVRIGPAVLEVTETRPSTLPGDQLSITDSPANADADQHSTSGMVTRTSIRESEDATGRGDLLELLAPAIDIALTAGRIDEAERLLADQLGSRLDDARGGAELPAELVDRAGHYAMKLALATRNPSWIDYTVQLYTILARPLPLSAIDQMSRAISELDGIDRPRFREYVAVLQSRNEQHSASERLAVERIQGLERLTSR